jgi:hypothetical protein
MDRVASAHYNRNKILTFLKTSETESTFRNNAPTNKSGIENGECDWLFELVPQSMENQQQASVPQNM